MNISHYEERQTVIFTIALISSIVSIAGVLGLAGFEAYVRWTINKEFVVLGGFGLEAFTFSAFALLASLAYLYRPTRE